MVHALKEAYRILTPNGTMMDMRPLSVDVPLEIIHTGGRDNAGMIDTSPGIEFDVAAEDAIASVLKEGLFFERNVENFDFTLFWKSIRAMQAYIEEKWKDDVIISEEVWRQAKKLLKMYRSQSKIRVGIQMKMGKY